jgi:hypothetical protein
VNPLCREAGQAQLWGWIELNFQDEQVSLAHQDSSVNTVNGATLIEPTATTFWINPDMAETSHDHVGLQARTGRVT